MGKILKCLKKRDWFFILLCVGLIVLQVWLDLKMPDYTSKLSESVAAGTPTMEVVWKNGGMMLLCAFGSLAASILCGFFAAQVAASVAMALRTKLFDAITDFSNAEIEKFGTPSLITRTTNDVVQIQMLIAMGLQVMIKAPILAIWALCKISATSVEWTTATLITVCVLFVVVGTLVAVCYPRFKKIQTLTDNLNDVTRENLSGVRVIRAFNAEGYQQNKFEKVNNEITSNHLITSRVMGLMMPVMTLCMNGLILAIYWIGAYLINDATGFSTVDGLPVSNKAIMLGNMTAYTQYALKIVMAFMLLIAIFIMVPRSMVSAKRIGEVLSTKPSIKFKKQTVEGEHNGRVEFKNVSFSYSGDEANACIRNLNFAIEAGQTFAIIGATGAGKSTVVNLIPRYYDVSSGEVLIDGVNIKEYPQKQLEQMVSIAPQKAILFMGDIKSNVTYGQGEEIADDDPRIERALNIAQAGFVYDLEKGIHSEVAQGGTNFSGGQKQRLSIARAVFKDANIVIFDDTFSALDYKTDMLVRKELNENLSDTTKIIVAQRIGTIKNADQILVLDHGKMVGLGTHEELLKTCSVYKEIALSQLKEEEL